jgi:hypothetical protein
MENAYSRTGFYWWVGVVEDRNDPIFLGRCKVRIVGYHTSDKVELPTTDLPWAFPMQPITSAAMSGVGITPTGPVEGTWVTGFFRDGEDCQEPVIMGTISGIPGKSYYDEIRNTANYGFQDPNKEYPREAYLKNSEPDTNRLARNQQINETIIKMKDDERQKGVPIAFEGTWDQPMTPYNAMYPYNHVYESESGHIVEVDDTKENERLATYHKKGTYWEVDRNGTMLRKVVGDNYEIIMRNNNVLIKGSANVTIEGNCNIYVKNNCNLQVDGNLKAHAHGDIEMKAGKKFSVTAPEGVDIHTDKTVNINANDKINIKSLKGLIMTGTLKTTIASPITEVAVLKMNGMSITPTPPVPPVIVPPSTISEKSPTLPTFPDLIVPTREEVLTFTLDVLGEDFEKNSKVIKQLVEQAITDGVITRAEIEEPPPAPKEVDETPTPKKEDVIPGCGDINSVTQLTESLKLSKHFTIASFTTQAAASKSRLTAFAGLTEREIACNMKALAEQVLDPIKDKYPNMFITSGFRNYVPEGGSTTSQHMKGQAADLQFRGASKADYFEIAKWIKQNVNYDQMLLEYKTTGTRNPWIHISFNRNGCRNTCSTFMNHKTAPNGRGVLVQLA